MSQRMVHTPAMPNSGSLIGYLTRRVAAGIIRGIVDRFPNDAQWGTLEQIWI